MTDDITYPVHYDGEHKIIFDAKGAVICSLEVDSPFALPEDVRGLLIRNAMNRAKICVADYKGKE